MNLPRIPSLNERCLQFRQGVEHLVFNFRNCIQPDTNLFVLVLFAFGCRDTIKEEVNLSLGIIHQFVSVVGRNIVHDARRNATQRCILKSELLYLFKYFSCGACTQFVKTAMDQGR